MISTQPFQTIESCKCLGFEFIAQRDTSYWYKNRRMIAAVIEENIPVGISYAVVHLNKFWLLSKNWNDEDDILRSVTGIVSDLGHVFLSRIHMSTYVRKIEMIHFIEQIIKYDAEYYFKMNYTQTDMFGSEPTFEMMPIELRNGLWIT